MDSTVIFYVILEGHTYDNECNLNSNACWNDLNTTVVRMGPCEMPLIEFIVAEEELDSIG